LRRRRRREICFSVVIRSFTEKENKANDKTSRERKEKNIKIN
jgi:hypothetical protein